MTRAWNSTFKVPTKGLARHAALQRHGYLKAVNPKRRKRREEAGDVYGPYYRWARDECTEPCALLFGTSGHKCGFYADRRRMEAHHVKTVGSGGKDAANLVRVCPHAHDLIHQHGRNYARERHGVDLIGAALDLYRHYGTEAA